MVKKLKYVIVSPKQDNGGAVVLHTLCKYLSEEGYNAKFFIQVFLFTIQNIKQDSGLNGL